MANLGKAISILLEAHSVEAEMHEDVRRFNAPSECHALVARGEAARLRFARRRAFHAAGVKNSRQLRAAARRVCSDHYFYKRYGIVPY